jgi:hypothetical protein
MTLQRTYQSISQTNFTNQHKQKKPNPISFNQLQTDCIEEDVNEAKFDSSRPRLNPIENTLKTLQNNPVKETTPPIQPKLTIGQPNDQYEQEADRGASEVMQRINVSATPPPEDNNNAVQKKPLISIQARREDHFQDFSIQPKIVITAPNIQGNFETNLNKSRSGGSPLDHVFRARIESEMGLTNVIQRQEIPSDQASSNNDNSYIESDINQTNQVTSFEDIEIAIRNLRNLSSLIEVGNLILQTSSGERNINYRGEIVRLVINNTQYAIYRNWLDDLFEITSESYTALHSEFSQRITPSNTEGRQPENVLPSSLRSAITNRRSLSGIGRQAVRRTAMTLTSLLLDQINPEVLMLWSRRISLPMFLLSIITSKTSISADWWDILRWSMIEHLYGFCMGYISTLKNRNISLSPRTFPPQTVVPDQIMAGRSLGEQVALDKILSLIDIGFPIDEIRENSRHLDLYMIAFNQLQASYKQTAENYILQKIQEINANNSRNILGSNQPRSPIHHINEIRVLIDSLGINRRMPEIRFVGRN